MTCPGHPDPDTSSSEAQGLTVMFCILVIAVSLSPSLPNPWDPVGFHLRSFLKWYLFSEDG